MNLPTQLDLLSIKIKQRDCSHVWHFLGLSAIPKVIEYFECIKCKKYKELCRVNNMEIEEEDE